MGMGTLIKKSDSILIKVLNDETHYFSILSNEWQELIIPVWKKHKTTSKIVGLYINNQLIGGGILFSKMPPYATNFEKSNAILFEKGYLYIGYIWISEKYRNKGYASAFLTLLKKENPHQKFWLTIEEGNLRYFYEQNGFTMHAESDDITTTKEWILIYNG